MYKHVGKKGVPNKNTCSCKGEGNRNGTNAISEDGSE